MATIWDRLQAAARAARDAWTGTPTLSDPFSESELLRGLDADTRKRIKGYDLRWSYYKGEHASHLKKRTGEPDPNVILNYSRRIVDKGVSFLFGKDVQYELAEGETTQEEEALETAWRSPEWRGAFLNELAQQGAVCGTFYVQVLPPDGEMPTSGYVPTTHREAPRIINLDPRIVIPHWHADDIDAVHTWEIRWMSDGRATRTIWAIDEDDATRWFYRDERWGKEGWEIITPQQEWPWPWSPIVHGKNLPLANSFYGLSDLEDADLNDAINLIGSNTNRILHIWAHPVMWGRGFSPDQMDRAVDRMSISSAPDALLDLLEMQSDLSSSANYMNQLISAYHKVTRVPEMNPDTMRLGAQSGFALKVLYGDLLEKTYTKRMLYGQALVEANRRLLDMMGWGDDNYTTLHWQDPLPKDPQDDMLRDTLDLERGLASKETVQVRRGLDPEVERERRLQEAIREGTIRDRELIAIEQDQGIRPETRREPMR